MDEFTQAQAAFLAGYPERDFRALVDKRIILPSPATRNFSRGKAKTFMRQEVRVASVFRRIDVGLSPWQQAGITDWIRAHLASAFHGVCNSPLYVMLATDIDDESWRGDFRAAYGDYVSEMNGTGGRYNDNRKLPIMLDEIPMSRFIAANVWDALKWDDDKIIGALLSDNTFNNVTLALENRNDVASKDVASKDVASKDEATD